MTGLILKDVYCLKRNLKTFAMVSIGVIVIAVLFILSCRYGNLAKGMEEMRVENNMSEEEFYSFYQMEIRLVLCLPAAFLTIIAECFKADRKAGFYKQMQVFPLSDKKIVGSRYAACLLLSIVCLADSFLAAFFVSLASEVFSFQDMIAYVCCFHGILLIYVGIVMLLIYVFGAEKTDLIQCVPFIIFLVVAVILFQKKISGMSDAQMDACMISMARDISEFITEQSFRIYLIALICMGVSFVGSCKVFQMRKGNI